MSTQTDWNTAAATYAGIPLCGCEGGITNGQKLYRSINYARTIAGLPVTDTPVNYQGESTCTLVLVELVTTLGPPLDGMYFIWTGTLPLGMCILQAGKGLQNPWIVALNTTDPDQYQPTDPEYQRWLPYFEQEYWPACNWVKGGGPKLQNNTIRLVNT